MAFLPEECACARVAHQQVSFGSTAQDSLGKNVSKELSFWLWGKNNQRYANSGCSLFFRGSNGVSQVCLLTHFYKQDPVWRWICTLFSTERWSSPSYKRSRPWFKTADGELNSIKCLCFVWWLRKRSSLFSSAHGVPPGARIFWENRKALYFLYKYDKTKDFLEIWRMEYYSICTQD